MDLDSKLRAFFRHIFGEVDGYLCIVTIDRADSKEKAVQEKFFDYKEEMESAIAYINKHRLQRDVYYCPHLLNERIRRKEYAISPKVLWADVDDCPVDFLKKEPTLIVQSSNDRAQALWGLHNPYPPEEIEAVNKRIAYYHQEEGMDKTGWDLTQLLRVPYSFNHKYSPPHNVDIILARPTNTYSLNEFRALYPEVEILEADNHQMPEELPDLTARDVILAYQTKINPRAIRLYEEEPEKDWSKALWELELSLMESGLPLDEAFIILKDAACNKYARDSRPERELWNELVRADRHVQSKYSPVIPREKPNYTVSAIARFSPIISDDERKIASEEPSLVEDYIEWAKTTGDASFQYHQAGAFIVLSTLLAGQVTLPTSFATIRPNMWFMILGDTTLTRKSTAMDLATDLLTEIDPSSLMATDGSIEGMLTQLSTRPGRPSLFLRDEFTGLLEQIAKKDYYAGMLEALTKLYDGRYQKRVLRKETIELVNPILNIFAGGIKEKALDLLQEQHVTSGFIPRFVFVMADTDLTRMRPVGPPTTEGLRERAAMASKLNDMYQYYKNANTEIDADEGRIQTTGTWEASLTNDAWIRYNKIENQLVTEALDSEREELVTPCMDRLAKTGLKVALIIAAGKCIGQDQIIVEERDIVHAFYYIEQWREYTLAVVEGAGSNPRERNLMKVFEYIDNQGTNVQRTEILRKFKFAAKEGEEVLSTLEERGLIVKGKQGGSYVYTTIGGM